MAGRKKKKKEKKPLFDDLAPHTKQAIWAVGFGVLGIYLTLALIEYAGIVGVFTKSALSFLFGGGSYLAPIVCAFYVYALLNPKENQEVSISKIVGIALFFLGSLGFLELYQEDLGGIGGWMLQAPLSYLLEDILTGVVLGAIMLVSVFLTFNTGLHLPGIFRKKAKEETDEDTVPEEEIEEEAAEDEPEEKAAEDESEDEGGKNEPKKKSVTELLGLAKNADFVVSSFQGQYEPPPLTLLNKGTGKAKNGDVKSNSNAIKRTLQDFGIKVEMDQVEIGSTVTRYSLKPAQGVKLTRIMSLQKELELNLGGCTIRIEAPIPGKSLVGIEVPNTTRATVGLSSLLKSPEFTDSSNPLLTALGKDIAGKAHFSNIAKMPHCLIAGTTGSGKSVMLHSLILSLLYRNSPEQLRLIMIDPKQVELSFYNGIPHLMTNVIIDAKKAILSLKWAIKEMERRLEILNANRVQNLATYHSNVYRPAKEDFESTKYEDPEEQAADSNALPEPLPYIVIVMDELADLMSAYPKELEASIVRLAQKSRAVGIHLILATQRPSVNVVTGTIKANIPARLAMRVTSQIDSRTILDQPGAEKLLGQGDMLFKSDEYLTPIRLQSAYVTEEELGKVVDFLKQQDGLQELDSIDLDTDNKDSNPDAFFNSVVEDEDDDELYNDAKQAVIEAGKASTSYLQRKLRVGYSRAARLIDMLEERGVIGEQDGSKAREILSEGADDAGEDTEAEDDEENIG